MGIEGIRSQHSLDRFFATVAADRNRGVRKAARELTAALAGRFRLRDSVQEIHSAVEQSLRALRDIDAGVQGAPEGLDPEALCLGLFRRRWFEAAHPLDHAGRAGFFAVQPCNVLSWVRWFLLVENYHRTDPEHHDRRLDRLRFLKTENPLAPCVTHEDLLLWLEHELLADEREPLPEVARRCVRQLERRLDATLRPDVPLEAFFYVLLRCHQFCLAETLSEEDAARLQTVLGRRRFLSLTELMLVVIHRVIDKEPLPDAVTVLEGLMADGFQLRHASFKDPYEADMVPPEETARFDEAVIRLFMPVEALSGFLEKDCRTVLEEWQERRRRVLDELLEEIRELERLVVRPLPRKHALAQTARLLTSWCLAFWEGAAHEKGPALLIDRVKAAVPERIVKALVRQRRGYELATRKELTELVERECRLQWDSYWKKAGSRTFGEADFRTTTRTQALASGPEPPADNAVDPVRLAESLKALADQVERFKVTEEAAASGSCLAGPISFPMMGTPMEFVAYFRDVVPMEEVSRHGPLWERVNPGELEALYERTAARCAGAFYRFVCADVKKAQGAILELSLAEVPDLAAVLVPPWGRVAEALAESALRRFQDQAEPLYRRRKNPVCVDREEIGVHLAHFLVRDLGADVLEAAETASVASLRTALVEEATRIIAPTSVRTSTAPEAFLLQWAGVLNGTKGAEELTRTLAATLPGLNCGACGESRCSAFALALAQGRRRAAECVHLSPAERHRLEDMLRSQATQAGGENGFGSAYDLFRNPQMWRCLSPGHPLRRSVVRVLDWSRQEVRRRVLDRAEEIWQGLEPKPSLFKRPSPEAFYESLVETLGYEAAERIRPEERHWLCRHGLKRLEKELERLNGRADWLTLERVRVSSGPFKQEADPETQSERFYGSVSYLHQLHELDRRRLLVHRMERFEEGFSQWWNQDLLAMNHPRYRIDNWEEFSKVIKNAYWHQENFPPPRRVASELLEELERDGEKEVFFRDLLASWMKSVPMEGTGALAAAVDEAVASGRAENLPAEALRAWIGDALAKGEDSGRVLEKVLSRLHQSPLWKERLLVDALQKMVSLTRWRVLTESFSGVVLEGIPQEEAAWYAENFPRWMPKVETAVRRKGDFDRDRLLHYLYVLAKREGDLDVITALLREIRETSDIIEAAWLQFTNDRLTEALPVPLAKGLGARYSLLLNRVKDHEAVRRCLSQGISRDEKADVAAAVRELLLYMRFHMVQDAAESMDLDACFESFWEEGYNVEGLDKDVLHQAFAREWKNRDRWRKDRVWIMTMAVARRLASQSHELYEADKAFAKLRQGLLKEEGPAEGRDLVRRRGIALGTIKEAMYRELSELLQRERMESFRTRIRQIVHELDRKRLRIVQSWFSGSLDRFSVFHILRQFQKRPEPPSSDDLRDFFLEQWFDRIERLRESHRQDRHDRIREADEGIQAVFGVSPLAMEKEAEKEAAREWSAWCRDVENQIRRLCLHAPA